MAIRGLTDRRGSDRSILGRIEITVFKGARKVNIQNRKKAGESLGDKYRIVCTNPRLLKILKAAYGKPDQNGDILTDTLNVIFPFDEGDRTFNTSMVAYSHSGLDVVCDRHTITQESVQVKDGKGNIFRPIKPCSKPCPVADQPMGFECPKGCKPTGVLYFYLRELLEVDLMVPCKLTVNSYNDITYLSSRLEALKEEIGSITNSPFPCFRTRHKVPFTLTRSQITIKRPVVGTKEEGYKRTGKNANGTTWAVEVNPDHEFMILLQAWRMAEEMRNRQIQLPQRAITGLLGGDPAAVSYIDVDIVPTQEQPSPISLMPSPINTEERRELFTIFLNENEWTKEAFQAMLNDEYGYTKTTEIMSHQIEDIKANAKDHKLRDRYIDMTVAF